METPNKPKRSKIVYILRTHPYYLSSNKGAISESRLAYAIYQGYNLTRDDVVVHKDEHPENNSISNLIKVSRDDANMITRRFRYIKAINKLQEAISVMESRLSRDGINPGTLEIESPRMYQADADMRRANKSRV